MAIRIGTSGWSYDHWQGVLYPHGASARERFEHYVRSFDTVEVNSPFYRWPAPGVFASWHRRSPEGFAMSVKAPRGLTHGARLYGPERWLGRMSQGLRYLGRKRGPLLVQLSPLFEYDYARLEYFLKSLRPWVRAAVEFRHPSWHRDEIFRLLEQTGHAYVVMSGAGLPCILRATTSFAYVRLHGPDPNHLYAGSYPDEDLRWWAARMHEWASGGVDVYAYFNNDGHGHAVRNAWAMKRFVWEHG